jgi:hypothetical protein
MVMAKYPINTSLTVYDTFGVDRVYPAYQEGTADLTEVVSMVERICGYSVTIRVEGELTLDKVGQVYTAFTGQTVDRVPPGTGGPGDPTTDGTVDPGPGGLIGDGQPTRRVTAMGSEE